MRPSTRVPMPPLSPSGRGVIWLGASHPRLISNDMLKTGRSSLKEIPARSRAGDLPSDPVHVGVINDVTPIVLVSGAVFLATSPYA